VKTGAYTAAIAVARQITLLHSVFPRKCNCELRMALSAAVFQAHAFSSYVTLALFMLAGLHLMLLPLGICCFVKDPPFVVYRTNDKEVEVT
jgi:hypothetical protein